jgi:hypothetical protein
MRLRSGTAKQSRAETVNQFGQPSSGAKALVPRIADARCGRSAGVFETGASTSSFRRRPRLRRSIPVLAYLTGKILLQQYFVRSMKRLRRNLEMSEVFTWYRSLRRRHRYRLSHLAPFVTHDSDLRPINRPNLQRVIRTRHQQSLQLIRCSAPLSEPSRPGVRREYDWHPVMERACDFVWWARDDRAALDVLALRRLPIATTRLYR